MPQPPRYDREMLIWDALNALPSRRAEVAALFRRHHMPCVRGREDVCVAAEAESIADGARLCRTDAAALVADLNALAGSASTVSAATRTDADR